jgi:hypothetical protein
VNTVEEPDEGKPSRPVLKAGGHGQPGSPSQQYQEGCDLLVAALRVDPDLEWGRNRLRRALKNRSRLSLFDRVRIPTGRLNGWWFVVPLILVAALTFSDRESTLGRALPQMTWLWNGVVVMTLVWWPLSDLRVLVLPLGRHALTRWERWWAVAVGVSTGVALVGLVVWLVTGDPAGLFAGGVATVLAGTWAATATSPKGWERWPVGAATVVTTALTAVGLVLYGIAVAEGSAGSLRFEDGHLVGGSEVVILGVLVWCAVGTLYLRFGVAVLESMWKRMSSQRAAG